MDEPSPRSQCVSLRLDLATITAIEEEVTEYNGVTLSAAMNIRLKKSIESLVKSTEKGGEGD